MHPLLYKQQRQLRNALRQSFSSPRQVLALLIVVLYGAASIAMIIVLLVFEPAAALREMLQGALGAGDPAARLVALRGGLVLTLLLLASTAAFQNPLLQFAQADIDLLFATPIPVRGVLRGRIVANHLRTFFAGFFFWGLAAVPALQLLGYSPLPLGIVAPFGLAMLFASIDQGFALAQIALLNRDLATERDGERPASHWLPRLALLAVGLAALLLLGGLLDRLLSGDWALLSGVLGLVSGPLSGTVLLPLGLAGDLLLAPAQPVLGRAGLALGGLLLLDLLTAAVLLNYVARRGAGLLIETALSPQSSPLSELLASSGPNPFKIIAALWYGEAAIAEGPMAGRSGDERRLVQTDRPPQRIALTGAWAHSWRRFLEMRRTPLRSGLAVLTLGLIPLAIYRSENGYSLARLLTAIIFSTSLSTQIFNDTADHLRHGNLELAAPISRWRLLLGALLPRVALYWLGGIVLLLGVGVTAAGARWHELALLALWYPLVLLPLLCVRATLVFFYPAAGIPGQKDPVQAVLVLLINGILVLIVIGLSLVPFGVLLALGAIFGFGEYLLWPVVLGCSALLSLACFALMAWAYRRYEPVE